MKNLHDIEYLQDVRVLVRVDFNVPIKNGMVADDYRIRMALPTIEFLRSKGAKVVLMSHIEVKDGEKATLEPVARQLVTLGVPVTFCKNFVNAFDDVNDLTSGGCILLENLRLFPGEKTNDPKFAKELASLGDIYVNEAFSASHREHASIVGVPSIIPGYAGLQLEREVLQLSKAFNPSHPFLFILGGAKFETKIPLLEKFVKEADTIFVGGALANDFYKAKGYEVGKSLVSEKNVDISKYLNDTKIVVPSDVVDEDHKTFSAGQLSSDQKIMDAGPESINALREKVDSASFVLWNGPLGLYEAGYKDATLAVAKMISARGRNITSIVGGGDTLAAIATLGVQDEFTFVSTAGGAMLDFLAQGTLPGIEALC